MSNPTNNDFDFTLSDLTGYGEKFMVPANDGGSDSVPFKGIHAEDAARLKELVEDGDGAEIADWIDCDFYAYLTNRDGIETSWDAARSALEDSIEDAFGICVSHFS